MVGHVLRTHAEAKHGVDGTLQTRALGAPVPSDSMVVADPSKGRASRPPQNTNIHNTQTLTSAPQSTQPSEHIPMCVAVPLFSSRVSADLRVVHMSSLVRWLIAWNLLEHCVT